MFTPTTVDTSSVNVAFSVTFSWGVDFAGVDRINHVNARWMVVDFDLCGLCVMCADCGW